MATINDIKNSAWASKFLAARGISLDDLDSIKNPQELTLAFEEFMFEKYHEQDISTPEEEDKAYSQEAQERLGEIYNSKFEYKPNGYHLKNINEDLDDVAYLCAVKSLALSEDEINQENFEKHIKQASNRIATEYYSGIWAAQQTDAKLKSHNTEHFANVVANISQLVENNQSKEEIYQKLFNGKKPSADAEKNITTIVINSNTEPATSWFKKMGEYGAKFLDKAQKLEKDYPFTALSTNLALGTVASPALLAYRMTLATRNIYKMSKESGKSVSEMLKDKEQRKELLNQGKAFARIIPGAGIFLSADSLKNYFKKEGRKSLVNTVLSTGKTIKTLWKSGGRDKQAWKDLGKSVATIGGVVLSAYAVYKGMDAISANAAQVDNNAQQAPATQDIVNQEMVTLRDNQNTQTHAFQTERPDNYVIDPDRSAEVDQQLAEASINTQTENIPDTVSLENSPNLTDEQQSLRYLLLREPAAVNEMIGDGKFHSSAELAKMWNDGSISDDMKTELLKYSEARFDDKGNFLDTTSGEIDKQAENAAKEWQAKHDAAKESVKGETNIQETSDNNKNPSDTNNMTPLETPEANFEMAQAQTLKDLESINNRENPENEVEINKIKIRNDGTIKVVGSNEESRITLNIAEIKGIENFKGINVDKIKFNDGEVTLSGTTPEGRDLSCTINNKGEYTNLKINGHIYEQKYLDQMNSVSELRNNALNNYQTATSIQNDLDNKETILSANTEIINNDTRPENVTKTQNETLSSNTYTASEETHADEIKSGHEKHVSEMISKHKQDVNEMRNNYKQDVNEMRNNYKQDVNEIRNEHKQFVDNVRNDYEQDVNEMRNNYKQDVNEIRNEHKQFVDNVRNNYKQDVNEIRNEHKQFVDNVRNDYKQDVNEIRNEHKQFVDNVRNDYKQDVNEMVNNHNEFENAHTISSSLFNIKYEIIDENKYEINLTGSAIPSYDISEYTQKYVDMQMQSDGSVTVGDKTYSADEIETYNRIHHHGFCRHIADNLYMQELVADDIKSRIGAGENVSEAELKFVENQAKQEETFTTYQRDDNGNVRTKIDMHGNHTNYDFHGNVMYSVSKGDIDGRTTNDGGVEYKITETDNGFKTEIKQGSFPKEYNLHYRNSFIENSEIKNISQDELKIRGKVPGEIPLVYQHAKDYTFKLSIQDAIYDDLQQREASGETLSTAEKDFMKSQEEIRNEHTSTIKYSNGNIKSETNYLGEERTYYRDGELKSFTSKDGVTTEYDKNGVEISGDKNNPASELANNRETIETSDNHSQSNSNNTAEHIKNLRGLENEKQTVSKTPANNYTTSKTIINTQNSGGR
ncbi:MAG: hypothetical protein E7012_06880 [Alphaproteobacteria bacterium]|nr:hypothetical protein [Alphaproteobacteria bacterium]